MHVIILHFIQTNKKIIYGPPKDKFLALPLVALIYVVIWRNKKWSTESQPFLLLVMIYIYIYIYIEREIGLTCIKDLRLSNTKTCLWALQMVIGLTNGKHLRVFDMHNALFIGSWALQKAQIH